MAKEVSETKAKKPPQETQEIRSIGRKPKVAAPPLVYKTHIAARLDQAVKNAKPVNRSSDLVPLSDDFDQMRRRLRSLIAAAKQYHTARAQVEKTRMEVRIQ